MSCRTVLQYVAWSALHGRWPYTDSFDSFFPGGTLVHMFVLAVMGPSAVALRAFDLVVQSATALVIFSMSRSLAGPRPAAVSALLYASMYAMESYYHTAQRDSSLAPLLLLGIWGLQHYRYSEKARWMAASGLNFGMACLVRPTCGALVAGLALYLLVEHGHRQDLRRRLGHLALPPLLSALPVLLFVGVYASRGGLSALGELVWLLLTVHPQIERASPVEVIAVALRHPPRLLWTVSG